MSSGETIHRDKIDDVCSSQIEQISDARALSLLLTGIDKNLPVALNVQIVGIIEFGIANNDIRQGDRLPTIRELAERTGMAPMTVANAYKQLKDKKLIISKGSAGTFIAPIEHSPMPETYTQLTDTIDTLLNLSADLHVSVADLISLIGARAGQRKHIKEKKYRVLLVGVFPQATKDYAAFVQELLAHQDVEISWTIVSILHNTNRVPLATDAILTLFNRKTEVAAFFPAETPIFGLHFIPSEATRMALASIDPQAKIGVVSIFPEFLALMKAGVTRFTPHVANPITATVLDSPDLDAFITTVDVIVYSTGCEWLAERTTKSQTSFEFRHIPDPNIITSQIMPRLNALRSNKLDKQD